MKTKSYFLFFLLSLFIVSCDGGNEFEDLVPKEQPAEEQKTEDNGEPGGQDDSEEEAVVHNDSIELIMTNYGKTVKFNMRKVENGSFSMGDKDNGPIHRVTLTQTYYMGETEVTQAQWETVMGALPTSLAKYADDYPVYNISWNECVSFVEKLNELTKSKRTDGKKFYIPTEAEWEFAAKGGNKTKGYVYSGSNTALEVANYASYVPEIIDKVKQRRGNELDIFDMSGNVWEWCADWYNSPYPSEAQTNPIGPDNGTYRVIRGGGTDVVTKYLMSACRGNCKPDEYKTNSPYGSSNCSYGRIGLRILLK